MSNSIWKTGNPTYNSDRSGDDIIMEYHRADGSKFYVVGDCSEPNDRWAYLTDIIAQADKAERLLAKVDELEHIKNGWAKFAEQKDEQIQRLQKAVDFLSGHLRDVLQLDEYGHIKLDEITKQQIKTAISAPVGIITQLEQESNN